VSSAPARAGEFVLDEEALAAAVKEVLPEIQKETGVEGSKLKVRLGKREDMVRTLTTELTGQLATALGDREAAEAQARLSAQLLAGALVAKYSYDEKVVFVCPENIQRLSRLISEPRLRTAAGLRAILAHECVHAADDARYDFRACLGAAGKPEVLETLSAVIEGHAQVLARRVCERKGWAEEFAAFTRSIDKVPDQGLSEGQKQLIRMLSAKIASAYSEGEKFMRFVEEKGGAEAVERAFRSPPAELALLENPEWYLDPSKRPAAEVDLSAPLKTLVAKYKAEEWSVRETSLTKAQMRVALNLLPEADQQWVTGAAKACRAIVFNPREAPTSKMIVAVLFRFDSAEDSKKFLEISGKLGRIKDEKMKEGAIRISGVRYERVTGEGWEGEISVKQIHVGPQSVEARSLVARSGTFCLEVTWSGEPVEEKEMARLAGSILSAVGAKPEPDSESKPRMNTD
jgi:hypothetical protein